MTRLLDKQSHVRSLRHRAEEVTRNWKKKAKAPSSSLKEKIAEAESTAANTQADAAALRKGLCQKSHLPADKGGFEDPNPVPEKVTHQPADKALLAFSKAKQPFSSAELQCNLLKLIAILSSDGDDSDHDPSSSNSEHESDNEDVE